MRSLFFFALSLGLLSACADASDVAAGGQCFQAIDCAQGLVCIPKTPKSQTRICVNSTQLASVETMIDSGMEAASADGGALPNYDAETVYDTGAGDVGSPDVGTTMKMDAGSGAKDSAAGG